MYEPAEDTFLLLDALEDDMSTLLNKRPSIILEIGSGSGVVITALAKFIGNVSYFMAIDVNKDACEVTGNTARLNKTNVSQFSNVSLLFCKC